MPEARRDNFKCRLARQVAAKDRQLPRYIDFHALY